MKEDHYIGGVERNGLCSVLAATTAALQKNYRETLRKDRNCILFDFLAKGHTTAMRSMLEKYSQSTTIAVKDSIYGVLCRQIGFLKSYEMNVSDGKRRYLRPGEAPFKELASTCIPRPAVPKITVLKKNGIDIEVDNWFADNYFCGEVKVEGAFFDIIHIAVWTSRDDQESLEFPEVNLEFAPFFMYMDMVLYTDNQIRPEGKVQYKWTFDQLMKMVAFKKCYNQRLSSNVFFGKGHFELFGKDPQKKLLSDFKTDLRCIDVNKEKSEDLILANWNIDALLISLLQQMWIVFNKHYPEHVGGRK